MAASPAIEALAGTLARLRPHPAREAAAVVGASARVPRATYRLQLNRDFGFLEAVGLVPYLAKLGVSHVYCSPILRARPGSAHGYDVVDHNEINPELGGREGFERFVAALRAQDMGLLLDIVPNHMGVMGADNAWWMDVLENGETSAYAGYFDIDWHPVNAELEGKVLVPVLGEHYGITLERGELVLAWEPDAGSFAVRYHQHRFPVAPREYPAILARAEQALEAQPATRAARDELAGLTVAFGGGPAQEVPALKERLLRLARMQPDVARAIDAALAEINAPPGDALHRLLEAQHYRLAFWRVASDEINYRRFFDINDLAALRMENEAVFEATHALVLALAADGEADGLRIDHSDGLYDPKQYFERLQQGYARAAGIALPAPETPGGRPPRPLYVVAEKITARHEHVPESWAVHGTTGYRFGAVVNGLFVDPATGARLERTWRTLQRRVLRLRGGVVPRQARHHARRARLRADRARKRAAAHRARRPAHARLHLQHAAPRAGRGRRLHAGLPHLHRRPSPRRRTGATSTGRWRAPRAAAAPPTPASSASCARRCSGARPPARRAACTPGRSASP